VENSKKRKNGFGLGVHRIWVAVFARGGGTWGFEQGSSRGVERLPIQDMLHMNECVMSHMNECVMSYMNACVVSHMNASCHVWMSASCHI